MVAPLRFARGAGVGHLLALVTVIFWGTTFLSSKVILAYLDPYWYVVIRFALAWGILFLLEPKPLERLGKKEEVTLAMCGATGVVLYYGLQNVSLLYTSASHAGVITAAAPLFTALILWLGRGQTRPTGFFFLGFLLCIGGILFLSLGGGGGEPSLLGDTLALLATLAWGSYCAQMADLPSVGLTPIQTTRRIFFWGVLLCVPLAMLLGEQVPLTAFVQGGFALWGNLLYVSVCSTALCYLTWNAAAKEIGPVATSVYLYLMPVVTVAASALLLGERPDRTTLLAVAAILLGLALSQKRGKPSVATG